jgi:hypothetical protein
MTRLHDEGSSGRVSTPAVVLIVTMLACALPALLTAFPPAADLPQHLAQVEQALHGSRAPGAYAAWWAPNNLIYAPIAALRPIVGPEHLASATIALLGLIWAGATCWLGARLQRPAGGIALASVLFFNASLSWGMLNFLIGWPLVLVWLAENATLRAVAPTTGRSGPTSARARAAADFLLRVALGWLLLWAHALCFAAACSFACLLALSPKSRRANVKHRLYQVFPLIPAGLYAVVWVVMLSEQRTAHGFDVAAHYAVALVERLDPAYFIPHSIAAGPLTWALFGVVMGWLLSGFGRPSPARRWDVSLAACAAFLALAYFALPSKYLNTIEFSSRWLPCMWMLFVLASPGPPVSARTATLATSGATLLVSASVSWNWRAFATTELAGLPAALEATPPHARLLGLDFLKESPLADGRPFLHLSSYATLLRGASTHFDFSEHDTALIRGARRAKPSTPGLEWFAERVQPADLDHFDVALVGAPPEYHEQVIARLPGLTALTTSGLWRLYRIETAPHAPAAAPPANTAAFSPASGSSNAEPVGTGEPAGIER